MKPDTDITCKALEKLETTTGIKAGIRTSLKKECDRTLELKCGKTDWKFSVIVLKTLNPATYGQFKLRTADFKYPPIIISTYITPSMAEQLREAQVNYLDTAGNAFIKEPPLFIYIKGNKPGVLPGKARRMFQTSGLKIIFSLLCNPGLEKVDYRTVASKSDVALGSITWVMRDLKQSGHLVSRGKKGRMLTGKDELLKNWVSYYHDQLKPRLFLGRFTSIDENWWKKISLKDRTLWGSEFAAKIITQYLNPGSFTLYVDGLSSGFLIDKRLHSSRDGTIEIYKKFWNFDDTWSKKNVVPPLLVYADLITSQSDRNIETARMIYDNEIEQLIREY